MVPYKYDYRIYLLAKTLDCLRNQVEDLNRAKPLGYLQPPQMNYTELFNRNFQDMVNYYNLITNEQKLYLLNYIITDNFYKNYDSYDDDIVYTEQPKPIIMSEFLSSQIWNVINEHIRGFYLSAAPNLI